MEILVIVGPSGVGKTTVAYRLLEDTGCFEFVRSATTRAPRGDGRDNEYIYLTREEFLSRVKNGKMLEHMEYGGNLYGTPASEVERILAEGKTPLLILDINGAKSLRAGNFPFRSIIVYLYADIDVITERLLSRDGSEPTAEQIKVAEVRRELNSRDYRSMPDIAYLFDDFIRNTSVQASADELMCSFTALCNGASRPTEKINAIADELASSV